MNIKAVSLAAELAMLTRAVWARPTSAMPFHIYILDRPLMDRLTPGGVGACR